jgi:ribosomal protein S18 acetylase RimI-like enzyme
MAVAVKRLVPADAERFRSIRLEGFRLQEREFRFSPADELAIPLDTVKARLDADFVAGAFVDDELVGIGGLTRLAGSKLNHRALLWGMYVNAAHRGSGVADQIMQALIDFATKAGIESIILTVMSENETACRFYRRWGFTVYGTDRSSMKLEDGSYLDDTLMVRPC